MSLCEKFTIKNLGGGGENELSEDDLKCSAVLSCYLISSDKEFLTLTSWFLNFADKLGNLC